jgi:hypothetical protein
MNSLINNLDGHHIRVALYASPAILAIVVAAVRMAYRMDRQRIIIGNDRNEHNSDLPRVITTYAIIWGVLLFRRVHIPLKNNTNLGGCIKCSRGCMAYGRKNFNLQKRE